MSLKKRHHKKKSIYNKLKGLISNLSFGILGILVIGFLISGLNRLFFNSGIDANYPDLSTLITKTKYEKKNWSSFMLMNCDKCTALTPDYVNSATGLQLHQFKWLENDDMIGELPLEWNWLVGEYEKKEKVNNIHFTEGGPWFVDYLNCDYSEEWIKLKEETTETNMVK